MIRVGHASNTEESTRVPVSPTGSLSTVVLRSAVEPHSEITCIAEQIYRIIDGRIDEGKRVRQSFEIRLHTERE